MNPPHHLLLHSKKSKSGCTHLSAIQRDKLNKLSSSSDYFSECPLQEDRNLLISYLLPHIHPSSKSSHITLILSWSGTRFLILIMIVILHEHGSLIWLEHTRRNSFTQLPAQPCTWYEGSPTKAVPSSKKFIKSGIFSSFLTVQLVSWEHCARNRMHAFYLFFLEGCWISLSKGGKWKGAGNMGHASDTTKDAHIRKARCGEESFTAIVTSHLLQNHLLYKDEIARKYGKL